MPPNEVKELTEALKASQAPWWAKLIQQIGVPSAMVLMILWFLGQAFNTQVIPMCKAFLEKLTIQSAIQSETMKSLEKIADESSDIVSDNNKIVTENNTLSKDMRTEILKSQQIQEQSQEIMRQSQGIQRDILETLKMSGP